MGLLLETQNCGLRMCRESFSRHRLQRKPLVSDPGMHRGTCVTHVPRCMSGSLTSDGGENVPGIPGACTTHNFTYLAKGLCQISWRFELCSVVSTQLRVGFLPTLREPYGSHRVVHQIYFGQIRLSSVSVSCVLPLGTLS